MTKNERDLKIRFLQAYKWACLELTRGSIVGTEEKNTSAELKARIETMIDSMRNPTDRLILKMKFIDGLSHVQLAKGINYSLTQSRIFFDSALERFPVLTDDDLALIMSEKS